MNEWRNIENGLIVPTEKGGYCDQPSIVVAQNGDWVCTVTTSSGIEGSSEQYVSIMISSDKGNNWTEPARLEEPEEGRFWESAYSKLFIAPNGRIFCFYCYNIEHVNIEEVPICRYDMGGAFCYKYSDDNGLSWSERMIIPIRDFKIDLFEPISYKENTLRFFWNVSRPYCSNNKLYIPLSKISCKDHFMKYTESVMLCSEDVFDNPTNSHWVTLPEGDIGIRGIEGGGSVAEELSFVNLSDDTIQATFRTVDGYAGLAISRDGGHNFGDSMYLTYPDGRRVKNSRAANFLWKLSEDRYLYWYQNCGYKGFYTRNPAWVCAAVETNTQEGKELRISQPEVLLYHESGSVGFSYPDIILDKGRYFITETQKTIARVHEIPSKYMDMLFSQFDICKVEQDCLLCDTHDKTITMPDVEPFIRQSNHIGGACQITTNVGYTLEFWLNYQGKEKLFDNLSDTAQGLLIETQDDGSVMVLLRDIREASLIDTRPGLLQAGLHHLCVVIDGASRVVCFVVDGLLEDGGSERIVGWGMLSRSINGIRGRAEAVLSDNIRRFRFYGKALTITECIGNWRAGLK